MTRISILLLFLVCGCEQTAPPFVQALPDGPLVVAHRGGAGEAPENTLAAFLRSADVSIAAEVMELDVHTTADDVLVVIHDRSVDRVTGEGNGCGTEPDTEDETFGTVLVQETELAELQSFNAGYCWEEPSATENDPESIRYPYRSSNATIPALEDVLINLDEQMFIVEVKQQEPSLVEELIEAIAGAGAMERVCFSNFDPDGASELAEHLPDNGCLALSSEGIRCWASEAIMPFGGGACERYDLGSVPHENGGYDLKKERFVSNIQATGAPVFMWTINEEPLMNQVLDLGVDGVLTDRPSLLREVIDGR